MQLKSLVKEKHRISMASITFNRLQSNCTGVVQSEITEIL